jgi:hypothetical protein
MTRPWLSSLQSHTYLNKHTNPVTDAHGLVLTDDKATAEVTPETYILAQANVSCD